MASKNSYGSDTDEEDDESGDSGFAHVGASYVSLIKASSIDTKEKLKHELERYKKVNDMLRGQISDLNSKVQSSERKLQREKSLIEAANNGQLAKKDVKIREAKVKMEDMTKRNAKLMLKISQYENTILALESNKNEMMHTLTLLRDASSNSVIKSESSKTEDTEKELLALKQRLQDMANELEENNKIIAMNLNEQIKLNEKLEQNTNEVKAVKNMLEEGKKREEKMANKVDNMEGMMKNVLKQVGALGQAPFHSDSRLLPARQQRTNASYRGRTQPQVGPQPRSVKLGTSKNPPTKGEQKPHWKYK